MSTNARHACLAAAVQPVDPYVIDDDRALELARESSEKGSRYGQHTLGELHDQGGHAVQRHYSQAIVIYRAAPAQGLDAAQCSLGKMYQCGCGVAQDLAEGLRLCQHAAAQGYPFAMFMIAECHERGCGVGADVAEAIRCTGAPKQRVVLQALQAG